MCRNQQGCRAGFVRGGFGGENISVKDEGDLSVELGGEEVDSFSVDGDAGQALSCSRADCYQIGGGFVTIAYHRVDEVNGLLGRMGEKRRRRNQSRVSSF